MNKKGIVKISGLLIGLVLFGFFLSIFATLAIQSTQYYPDVDYNQSQLSQYNQTINKTATIVKEIEDRTDDNQSGAVDRLGDLVANSYGAVKLADQSIVLSNELAKEVTQNEYIRPAGNHLKTLLIAVGLILFVFALLSLVVRHSA